MKHRFALPPYRDCHGGPRRADKGSGISPLRFSFWPFRPDSMQCQHRPAFLRSYPVQLWFESRPNCSLRATLTRRGVALFAGIQWISTICEAHTPVQIRCVMRLPGSHPENRSVLPERPLSMHRLHFRYDWRILRQTKIYLPKMIAWNPENPASKHLGDYPSGFWLAALKPAILLDRPAPAVRQGQEASKIHLRAQ